MTDESRSVKKGDLGLSSKTTKNNAECWSVMPKSSSIENLDNKGKKSSERQNAKDKKNTKQPKFNNEPITNIGEVYGSRHVARSPLEY